MVRDPVGPNPNKPSALVLKDNVPPGGAVSLSGVALGSSFAAIFRDEIAARLAAQRPDEGGNGVRA